MKHRDYVRNKIIDTRLKTIFMYNPETEYALKTFYNYFMDYSDYEIRRSISRLIDSGFISKYRSNRENRYFLTKIIHYKYPKNFQIFKESIDNSMTFGIEIEFGAIISQEDMARLLHYINLKHEVLNESACAGGYERDYWKVTEDGSILVDGGFNEDLEITTPVLQGENGIEELYKVVKYLNFLKSEGVIKLSRTCGLHIHHGNFKTPITKLIDMMERSQPVMNTLVKSYRVIDEYRYHMDDDYQEKMGSYASMPVKKEKYYKDGRKVDYCSDKYLNLNINKYRKYKTVEFRQYHGTISFREIASWLIINQLTIKAGKNRKVKFNDVRDYFNNIELHNMYVRNGCYGKVS